MTFHINSHRVAWGTCEKRINMYFLVIKLTLSKCLGLDLQHLFTPKHEYYDDYGLKDIMGKGEDAGYHIFAVRS